MKKIVGLGACVLDTLIACKDFPSEDHKFCADSIKTLMGGPVSNALLTSAKMGIESHYIGCLAGDDKGQFLLSQFKGNNVSTNSTKIISNTQSFVSYVILTANGSRTCMFNRGSVPDDPNLINYGEIDNADVLHLDGNYLQSAIACARYAKSKGVKVSLDAGGLYQGIENLLPYVDILIPSEEFALGITGKEVVEDAIIDLQRKYSPEILVVTQGVKGGCYVKNDSVYHYDSYKVTCVDSNGAGDVFHGAFLSAYCNGKNVEECCKFASAVSALKCTKIGVMNALPTKTQVEEFLKK